MFTVTGGLFCVFACFVAFSIGLNIGLLGIINFDNSAPRIYRVNELKNERTQEPNDAIKKENNLQTHITEESFIPMLRTKSLLQTVGPKPSKLVQTDTPEVHKTASLGPISNYINSGGDIPIILLTSNRPALLEETIKSFLNVTNSQNGKNLIIIQDGSMEKISSIANKYNIELVQNLQTASVRGASLDGAERIAMHYKFSLTTAFEMRPTAPAIIIIEDDLLFSPDFLEYFYNIGPILDVDKSVFAVSAWNDNGFAGRVHDVYQLHRTEFFPGLGWLLPKSLYKGELESQWPHSHWDHWLRSGYMFYVVCNGLSILITTISLIGFLHFVM